MSDFIKVLDHLHFTLKKVSVVKVLKPFIIENYYDIENTVIFPINSRLRYGKYTKKVKKESFLFIPANKVVSLAFGKGRSVRLSYDDFLEEKEKYVTKDNFLRRNPIDQKYLVLNFETKVLNSINIFHSKNLKPLVIERNAQTLSILKDIVKERYYRYPGSEKLIDLQSQRLSIEIIRYILSNQPLFSSIEENFRYFKDERILDLFQYVSDNIDKELSNKKLADFLNISEEYVGQYFKNNTGYSPQDYIELRRMEEAIKMLRSDDESIKVIGMKVGFKDTAYFCRRFKLMFGVQAGMMRKRFNEI